MVTVGKNVRFIIAFFMVIGIFAGLAPVSEAIIRIMPLGDSITRGFTGSTDHTGYRRELDLTLTGDGYPFDFVGNLVEPIGLPNDFDKDHEGHSGFTDGDLAAEVYNYLTTNRPISYYCISVRTMSISIRAQPKWRPSLMRLTAMRLIMRQPFGSFWPLSSTAIASSMVRRASIVIGPRTITTMLESWPRIALF